MVKARRLHEVNVKASVVSGTTTMHQRTSTHLARARQRTGGYLAGRVERGEALAWVEVGQGERDRGPRRDGGAGCARPADVVLRYVVCDMSAELFEEWLGELMA